MNQQKITWHKNDGSVTPKTEVKSAMCVEVTFLAGTNVENAVKEAKEKAEKWDVAYITFDFNGTSFSIGRNADVYEAVNEYESMNGKRHGICHQ